MSPSCSPSNPSSTRNTLSSSSSSSTSSPPTPSPSPSNPTPPPSSILILGTGVFGLSTAHALTRDPYYHTTQITLLDRSPFPAPDGSSIDSSRIVRADYYDPAYARLGARSQTTWRDTSEAGLGGQGRYSESGLVLVADRGSQGEEYVRRSFENVEAMMRRVGDGDGVAPLRTRGEIREAMGLGMGTGIDYAKTDGQRTVGTEGSGDWGYINRRSGWADAEAAMRWLYTQVQATGRVQFRTGEAVKLIRQKGHPSPDPSAARKKRVVGARLKDGSSLFGDLTIVATGAWTGSLVDLRGRCTATGQVLAYLELTAAEQDQLSAMPVLLNLSSGMFVIPPRGRILKVARHGYGYSNPVSIDDPDLDSDDELEVEAGSDAESAAARTQPRPQRVRPARITVSLPRTSWDSTAPSDTSAHSTPNSIPAEGLAACRAFLRQIFPTSSFSELSERPFHRTRICWYSDTPTGDFLISYHPAFEGLFLATGGSGHGFKFLPEIGREVVEIVKAGPVGSDRAMEMEMKGTGGRDDRKGRKSKGVKAKDAKQEGHDVDADEVEDEDENGFRSKWMWPAQRVEQVVTEDGSRGGRPGMVLETEMRKGARL